MATDIAFAVGVLALLGARVPTGLRILLLALAVIDDIGAILVIAVFYSDGVALAGLGVAAAGVIATIVAQRIGLRRAWHYLPAGVVIWGGLLAGGVHPTLGGVIVGLLTPARAWLGPAGFAADAAPRIARTAALKGHDLLHEIDAIERTRREAVSPADLLIHRLHGVVAFVIMPIFALANAGVTLGGAGIGAGDGRFVLLGIVLGLVVGKTSGIALACAASSAAGIASRPSGATWSGIGLVGMVGGIGFTMALFIAQLAFPPGALLETAKVAILIGSAIAALVGLAFGALTLPRRMEPPAAPPGV